MFIFERHVVTIKQKRLVSFPFTPKFFEGPLQATAAGHFFLRSIKKSPQQISLRGFFCYIMPCQRKITSAIRAEPMKVPRKTAMATKKLRNPSLRKSAQFDPTEMPA